MCPKLIAIFISLVSFHVATLSAADLGAARSLSSENESLELRINIAGFGDIDPSDVIIRFASAEIYSGLALRRDPFLNDVIISLVASGQNAYVTLSSNEGFDSSSLSFLLEVVTPNEMVLGEYDVTFGPSAFGVEQQVVNVFRAPYGSGVESYRLETLLIADGDTLWALASRARDGDPATTQQTMLSLLESNPSAFRGNNINTLLAGETLQIPSLSKILEISAPLAAAEVARQNQEYLRKVSRDNEFMELQAANGALDQRILELEGQVAASRAQAEVTRRQRDDLRSRLSELQSDIALAREVINVRDTELARLRQQALAVVGPQGVNDSEALGDGQQLLGNARNFVASHSIALFGGLFVALLFFTMVLRNRRPKSSEENGAEKDGKPFIAGPVGEVDENIGSEGSSAISQASSDEGIGESQNPSMSDLSPRAEGTAYGVGEASADLDTSPLDFAAASADQGSFGDLGFLSDQEKSEIESVESVEEIFYLGDEESATKLELAYAYQNMGDPDGAIEILQEVIKEGSNEQVEEAKKFINNLIKTNK
jgi:FimV-like protein